MINEQLHTSNKGFMVINTANVNAVYGPWESVNAAKSFLSERFSKLDDNFLIVSTIPVGTTVGVYDDSSKQTVTEYWWSSNNLVLKTFGNIHYELQLYDNLDNLIKEINIRNGYIHSPEYVRPVTIDNSTKLIVNTGYIRYSYDTSEFITYNPNVDRLGISTDKATHSLLVEWLDNDGLLITSLTLPVYGLSNITLIFYSYNNSETDAPPISIEGNYLNEDWTPNTYGSTVWSKTRFGITNDNHIEWAVSRERIDGKWGDLSSPIITSRWGIAAISSTVKLTLYYYTNSLVNNYTNFFDKSLDYLNTIDDEELQDSYSIDGKIWYKDFKGVTSKERYCYITLRDANPDNHSLWTTPALFANFAVDGKDADDVEYIYCTSSTNILNNSELQQLKQIESIYSTTAFNPGKKLDFGTSGNWTDNPSGVTLDIRYEFCAMRKNTKDDLGIINYGKFEDPFIWAAFGEQGPDGPGLEYIYILSSDITDIPTIDCTSKYNNKSFYDDEYLPLNSKTNTRWSDNPKQVTHAYPVLWMSSRKGSSGKWDEFSEPIIWNQFTLFYEIRLSNDNCSIPASAEGVYSKDVISKATATKVEVFLGNVDVTNDVTISCLGYQQHPVSKLWYTDNTDLVFDPVYLATFTATKNGEEVATKTQSLLLNKGTEGYSLTCIPNARIWYGGSDYSNDTFSIKVYKYDSTGVYTELTGLDLKGFSLKLQISDDTSTSESINLTSDNTIKCISNATYNDIYVSLIKDSVMVDYDIIDSVDYSRIKGKDHEGIVLECSDNINIPINKRNSVEYIRNATRTKLRLYKGISDISNLAVFSAEAVSLENPLTETITVLLDAYDRSVFYLNKELSSDIQIVYSATIKVDNEDVEYVATQHVNLSSELLTYELRPNITHLISNTSEGLDLSTINFNIFTSDSVIPNYIINASIEGTELTTSISGNSELSIFNIPTNFINYFKNSSTNLYLTFSLEINGKIEDWETITVSPTPSSIGYNYTIDLSDPYLLIPIDLSSGVLEEFSLNTFTVYLGSQKINGLLSASSYPYYKVTTLDDISGVELKVQNSDWTSCITKYIENIDKITYKITIYEDANTSYDFYKSLNIAFVNQVVYKLISNPTSLVAEANLSGTFVYTPIVLKVLNGELSNVSDLKSENLICKCGDITFTSAKSLSYTNNTSSLIVLLYKDDVFYDLDDIAIVRNGIPGEDGISYEYIYGRLIDTNINNINPEDLKKQPYNTINLYTKDELNLSAGYADIGLIRWYDEPQGVNEINIQEFVSVSKKESNSWTNFTDPVIYAHFGVQGDDGPGVEYIYVNTNAKLETGVVKNGETVLGFTIKNTVYNNKNLTVSGINTIVNSDESIPSTWSDNIEEVSSSYPYLYMSYRKKIGGHWGAYALPVLWNLYIYNLECIIDNSTIIVDNNANNSILKDLSLTKFTAFYNDSPIIFSNTLKPSILISGISNLRVSDPEFNNDKSEISYYLIKENDQDLALGSGLITYSFEYNGKVVTKVLSIQIKDFSVGEGYKLLVSPSVIPVIYENNKYTWTDLTINVEAVVITGAENTKVNFDNSYKLYLDDTLVEPLFTIKADSVSSIVPKIISLYKNDVKVDVLTISFSTKGADGESKFKSTVFKRSGLNVKVDPPKGGDYYNPVPTGWSDGIPEFDITEPLVWSSYRYFSTTDSVLPDWSAPQLMLDSDEFDVAYSTLDQPAEPTGHGSNHGSDWTNEPTSDAIWMATSNRLAGGDWSSWVITKIKGEKGEKGEDGINGESPIVINLTDDTDSIIVNLDITNNFNESTTIQVYYEGSKLQSRTDFDYNSIVAHNVPTGIIFSTDADDLNFTITPEFYNNNKSAKIPIDISIKYNKKNYSNSIDYQILVLNDLIKREIVPSLNVINLDLGLQDRPSITYEVHEYNNGLKTVYQPNTCPSELSVKWLYLLNSIITSTDVSELYVPENISYIDLILEKKQTKELLDKERIPIVYNGKNGLDGLDGEDGSNGTSASLRMMGKWQFSALYYYQQKDGDILYTDVVSHESNGVLKFYQAKLSSLGLNPSSSVGYWLEIAFSEVTLTLELLITNSLNKITGGFVDVEKALKQLDPNKLLTNDGIILWAGSEPKGTSVESANNATFSVTRSGVIRAKEGLFEGMYASKQKIFLTSPTVTSLPFIPIINDNFCDGIVDFKLLNETSFFIRNEGPTGHYTLLLTEESLLIETSQPIIYLPTGFMLPKLNGDKLDGVQALYEISLLLEVDLGDPKLSGANLISYSIDNVLGYLGDPDNELSLNEPLIKWLLSKLGKSLNDYLYLSDSFSILRRLVKDPEFAEQLYQYHRHLFINALSYVGKTFTFINAPEIKGIRGYIHKGTNTTDNTELFVPATQLELNYISNKYYSDGLLICKEVDPTLFELGYYIVNKDWIRYTDYDKANYLNTGLISVQCKLIPISTDLLGGQTQCAYIGWDVISGPFDSGSGEANPDIVFPSVNYQQIS